MREILADMMCDTYGRVCTAVIALLLAALAGCFVMAIRETNACHARGGQMVESTRCTK